MSINVFHRLIKINIKTVKHMVQRADTIKQKSKKLTPKLTINKLKYGIIIRKQKCGKFLFGCLYVALWLQTHWLVFNY